MEEVILYLSLQRFSERQREVGLREEKGTSDRSCHVDNVMETRGERQDVGSSRVAIANHLSRSC